MSLLTKLGLFELTIAVLSGWAMVATLEAPHVLKRAGIKHLARIRQTHLDLLFQGVILVAVGVAASPVPTWIGVLLVMGAFGAPAMFMPLAVNADLRTSSTLYRAVDIVVLTGFSVGWVALAVTVAGR
jgi:hypothetical protein